MAKDKKEDKDVKVVKGISDKVNPDKVHTPTKSGSGAYNSEGVRVCD
jgi:hypothetical protein